MRDRINLPRTQFNIQFEKKLRKSITFDDKFLRRAVLDTPTLLSDDEWRLIYPRDFRLLRILCIAQWWFPEFLHWRVYLDLLEKREFSWLNRKQRVELNVYLSSKENTLKYLYWTKRYSSCEIFGNFIGQDLKSLLTSLKIKKEQKGPVQRKIRRRGYQDHGSRKPDHEWLESFDSTFTENQLKIEEERNLTHRITIRILVALSEKE